MMTRSADLLSVALFGALVTGCDAGPLGVRTDPDGHSLQSLFDAVAPSQPAGTVVDQSFTSPDNSGAAINECCKFLAQTFTAGLTGTLGGVNIDVFSTSAFPLHVAVRTVTPEGVPSSTILGETTLSSSSAPLSLLITFPQTINIIAGVQYAIVVNYEGAPPPGPRQAQGQWSGAIGDSYPGGRGYASFSDGISWFQVAVPDGDLHFQTYVTVAFEVGIDIKPGSDLNSINPKSRGTIPVAILSAADFDAPGELDRASLTFGRTGDEQSLAFCTWSAEDVNADGRLDLVCHFTTQQTGFQAGATEGILKGETLQGAPIEGRDGVRII